MTCGNRRENESRHGGDVGCGDVGWMWRRAENNIRSSATAPQEDRLSADITERMVDLGWSELSVLHLRDFLLTQGDIERRECSHAKNFALEEFVRIPRPDNRLQCCESFTLSEVKVKAPGLGDLATGSFLEKDEVLPCGRSGGRKHYDHPAINHRRSLHPFAESTGISRIIHSPMRGYPVLQTPIPWLSRWFFVYINMALSCLAIKAQAHSRRGSSNIILPPSR
jgi:hypothetical protein